jgi:hypothetical protein
MARKNRVTGDGWTVEIVKDNLSELEAFELEREKVIEYGGHARGGGKLTNLVAGGEQPLVATISIEIPDFGWSEAYHAAREFRVLSRLDQETLVKNFLAEIESTEGALDDLDYAGSENEDDSLGESASIVANVVRNVTEDGTRFLKRKISWKDLCMGIESASDELAAEIGNLRTHHARVRPLLELAASKTLAIFHAIDSGNRKAAEAYADKVAEKNAEFA